MNAETTELLREAAEWRLLSLLFDCPGDDWRGQVKALALEISDPDLTSVAMSAIEESGEGCYHSTFGPGGPAAAREVSYQEHALPGALLSEIGAYYRVFAYEPGTEEPPDHIAVEIGFIAYLRLKQAYADAREDDNHAAVTAAAAQQFIENHLQYMAEPLAHSLNASGINYLANAGRALLQRVGPRKANTSSPLPLACPLQEGCTWADAEP